jgi:hypothetical protein
MVRPITVIEICDIAAEKCALAGNGVMAVDDDAQAHASHTAT